MPPVDLFTSGTPQQVYLTLSAAAKALTRFLLEGLALPDVLKQHGSFFFAIASGATATALFHYFKQHRNNRKMINRAVFHILRTIENHPHYQAQLQLGNIHGLIHAMDAEVNHMIDTHLTKDQASSAKIELKRKIGIVVDENRVLGVKRRMIDAAVAKVTIEQEDVAVDGPSVEPVYTAAAKAEFTLPSSKAHSIGEYDVVKDQAVTVSVQTPVDMAATRVRSASPLTEPRTQTQLLCEQQELENMDMMDVDAVLPTRAVAYEHDTTTLAMSSSSEVPAPATPCPRPEGYGLDYGDRALYSSSPESSPPCSPVTSLPCSPVTSPPCSPVSSSPITVATTTVQARQVIALPEFDPTTLLFLLDTPPLVRKPKKNTSSSPKTNAGKQMLRRDLFPILEGNSPHVSPEASAFSYRVAETWAFYRELKISRQKRRFLRNLFKQGKKIVRALQELRESFHCSETSCDSFTDAACIMEEAATHVQQQPSSRCSEASHSSSPDAFPVTEEALVEEIVVEAAVTPAPPVKKAARSPQTPQMPRKARGNFSDTSAEVRRSARKGAFKGKYTC